MMEEEKEGFTFIWGIENFYACDDAFNSSWFFPRIQDQTTSLLNRKFRLRLFREDKQPSLSYIKCKLQTCDRNGKFRFQRGTSNLPCVNFTVSFVKSDGSFEIFYAGQIHDSTKVKCLMQTCNSKDVIYKTENGYVEVNTLTIRCHLWSCSKSCISPLKILRCLAYTKYFLETNVFEFKIKKDHSNQTGAKRTVYLTQSESPLNVVLRKRNKNYVIDIENIYVFEDEMDDILCTVRALSGETDDTLYSDWLSKDDLSDGAEWKLPIEIDLNQYTSLTCEDLTLRVNLNVYYGKNISWVEEISECETPNEPSCSNSSPSQENKIVQTDNLSSEELCKTPADDPGCSDPSPSQEHRMVQTDSLSSDPSPSQEYRMVQTDNVSSEEPCKTPANNIQLQNAMWTLYRERKLCDFTLAVGRATFPVHMAILGGRSPVFCAMFESSMKEKDSKVAEITDLSIPTVEHFLRYLYCDVLEEMSLESTVQMYFAADKYQVDDLKSKCSSILESGLSSLSVCRVLRVADMHQDHGLMEVAKKYTFKNAKAVFSSEEWKQFKSENLQFASDLMVESFSIPS